MSLTTRRLQPREVGFDTVDLFSEAQAKTMVAAGLTFCVQYVDTMTRDRLAMLTGAGLAVMLTGYARTTGWSSDAGLEDGKRIAGKALACDFPSDASLWFDQEDGVPSESVAIAYATGCWNGATTEGIADPGLYNGAGSGFVTPATLHGAIPFRRYWRSLSQVENVAVRGYQLLQLFPPNEIGPAGFRVDWDVVQSDYLGGLPRAAIAA
ncbi:MAG TPA: hypothetical protein VE987_12905 [Polyangiaceae bacterium]|nr:hypothetical protein [Polyangiaceae bacterium]